MINLTVFFLFGQIVFILGGKHICTSNVTVELEADKIEFIETPDFPRFMTSDETKQCGITFTKKLAPGEENKSLKIEITNAMCGIDICDTSPIYVENSTSYYFDMRRFTAFRGYAYYDDWNADLEAENCPLESVCRLTPFDFIDESQFLTIASENEHPCMWQFTSPNGYQFKVYFGEYYNYDEQMNMNIISLPPFLKIENQDSVLADKFDSYSVYYFKENYIKIQTFNVEYARFNAYVSITKIDYNITLADCGVVDGVYGNLVWSSAPFSGIPDYAYCSFNLLIPSNTEFFPSIPVKNFIEYPADTLKFFFDGPSMPPIVWDLDEIALFPNSNNTNRNVKWIFESDGSWSSQSFTVLFEKYNCTCNENSVFTVPCEDESSYNIMGNDDSVYCGNLECFFTLQLNSSCTPTNYFRIRVEICLRDYSFKDCDLATNNDDEIFDVFRILSNNITVYEINYLNRWSNHLTFLSSNASNIFQVKTVPSFIIRKLRILLAPFSAGLKNVILTETVPYFAYFECSDISHFSLQLSPELINKNATIEIYLSDIVILQELSFFEDISLLKELDFSNCPAGKHHEDDGGCCKKDIAEAKGCCKKQFAEAKPKCHFNHFIALKNEFKGCSGTSVILFQLSTFASENCIFSNNVFILGDDLLPVPPSVVSSKTNECTVFFLNIYDNEHFVPNSVLKNIWTSKKNGSIKLYAETEDNLLADISLEKINFWRDIVLDSIFYIVKVPKNTAAQFNFSWNSETKISQFPFYSMTIAEIEYRDFPDYTLDKFVTVDYQIKFYNTKFTVVKFNVSLAEVYFIDNGTKYIIDSAGFSKTFINTNISLVYHCLGFQIFCDIGTVMSFTIFVETLDNSDNIVSSPSTTLSTSVLFDTTTTTLPSSAKINSNVFALLFISYSFLHTSFTNWV